MSNEQITFDGPAASGKSTVAKLVASKMNAAYVNTGDMYRTLTWQAQSRNIDVHTQEDQIVALLDEIDVRYVNDETQGLILKCDGEVVDYTAIRGPKVTAEVSYVAKIAQVRHWLVERQRQSAELGLIVMEGRDIGTVVFPEAKYKFFVTASPLVRAQRRLAQDGEVTEDATVEKVAAEIAKRDELDMNREISPLRPAEDSTLVDTSDLTIDQVVENIIAEVKAKQA